MMIAASGSAAMFVFKALSNMQCRCDSYNPPGLRSGRTLISRVPHITGPRLPIPQTSGIPGTGNTPPRLPSCLPVAMPGGEGASLRLARADPYRESSSGDAGHPLDVDALDLGFDGGQSIHDVRFRQVDVQIGLAPPEGHEVEEVGSVVDHV